MYKVLSIAGSDCSGGAGIQADIKTITAHGMYAESVITALTAQNTMGVFGIYDVTPLFVEKQIDCVFEDIYPDAVKTGMVSNVEIIKTIAKCLLKYGARNIVVDPVMVSTSGSRLISEDAEKAITDTLFPVATLITPNIPEAQTLCGFEVKNEEDMIRAAESIEKRCGCAVLVKGGHLVNDATDILCHKGSVRKISSKRIESKNTHGTGCTLSSAIACNLASGKNLYESVKSAKEYLSGALAAGLDLGHGSGPLMHNYNIKNK